MDKFTRIDMSIRYGGDVIFLSYTTGSRNHILAHRHDRYCVGMNSTADRGVRYFAMVRCAMTSLLDGWPEVALCHVRAIRWGSWWCRDAETFGTARAVRRFTVRWGLLSGFSLGLDKWLPAVWMIVNEERGTVAGSLANESLWHVRIGLGPMHNGASQTGGEAMKLIGRGRMGQVQVKGPTGAYDGGGWLLERGTEGKAVHSRRSQVKRGMCRVWSGKCVLQ